MSESILDLESGPQRSRLCPESYIPAEASSITRKQAGELGPRFAKGTPCVSQPKGRKKIIPCPTASLPVIVFCRACIIKTV